jgi:hypothetical protein
MMIRFIKPYGLLVKGQEIDCPDNVAEQLIIQHRAVKIDDKQTKKAKKNDNPNL